MSNSCTTYFHQAGWRCKELSNQLLYISTPLTLADGKPLDFYVKTNGSGTHISDDGMTLFGLSSLGFNFTDRRNWKGLENLAKQFGFELSKNGAFEGHFQVGDEGKAGEKILQLFAFIKEWEREHSEQGDQDFTLTDRVEMIMKLRNPFTKIETDVSVQMGKAKLDFHFKWGDRYVDAIKPSNSSVNSRLRKAVIASRADMEDQVLFIIDDTHLKQKASDELGVLGGVAKAILLSSFEASNEEFV